MMAGSDIGAGAAGIGHTPAVIGQCRRSWSVGYPGFGHGLRGDDIAMVDDRARAGRCWLIRPVAHPAGLKAAKCAVLVPARGVKPGIAAGEVDGRAVS